MSQSANTTARRRENVDAYSGNNNGLNASLLDASRRRAEEPTASSSLARQRWELEVENTRLSQRVRDLETQILQAQDKSEACVNAAVDGAWDEFKHLRLKANAEQLESIATAQALVQRLQDALVESEQELAEEFEKRIAAEAKLEDSASRNRIQLEKEGNRIMELSETLRHEAEARVVLEQLLVAEQKAREEMEGNYRSKIVALQSQVSSLETAVRNATISVEEREEDILQMREEEASLRRLLNDERRKAEMADGRISDSEKISQESLRKADDLIQAAVAAHQSTVNLLEEERAQRYGSESRIKALEREINEMEDQLHFQEESHRRRCAALEAERDEQQELHRRRCSALEAEREAALRDLEIVRDSAIDRATDVELDALDRRRQDMNFFAKSHFLSGVRKIIMQVKFIWLHAWRITVRKIVAQRCKELLIKEMSNHEAATVARCDECLKIETDHRSELEAQLRAEFLLRDNLEKHLSDMKSRAEIAEETIKMLSKERDAHYEALKESMKREQWSGQQIDSLAETSNVTTFDLSGRLAEREAEVEGLEALLRQCRVDRDHAQHNAAASIEQLRVERRVWEERERELLLSIEELKMQLDDLGVETRSIQKHGQAADVVTSNYQSNFNQSMNPGGSVETDDNGYLDENSRDFVGTIAALKRQIASIKSHSEGQEEYLSSVIADQNQLILLLRHALENANHTAQIATRDCQQKDEAVIEMEVRISQLMTDFDRKEQEWEDASESRERDIDELHRQVQQIKIDAIHREDQLNSTIAEQTEFISMLTKSLEDTGVSNPFCASVGARIRDMQKQAVVQASSLYGSKSNSNPTLPDPPLIGRAANVSSGYPCS